MEDIMVEHAELVERWPKVFGPDGIVPPGEFEEIAEKAYDIMISESGNSLKVSFLFENNEVSDVFKTGADLVGCLAPTNISISSVDITGGCFVYADIDWEDNDGGE
jgi:hypothetical protein